MHSDHMREVLQKIATGPTLSKDLSQEEAYQAMSFVLSSDADPVQTGIFLIALRMKRETDDELAGILNAINDSIIRHPLALQDLTTIVDPYDGFLRSTPAGPFLAPVMAACGLRVLSHGVQSMGPKFGASHEQVLKAAGLSLPHTLLEAAQQLENPDIGWTYLSQSQFAPKLAALSELRTRIVKRPCLTTLEVAVNAFKPKGENHLVTGYVHKPYPPIYAMVAQQANYSSSTLIRGVEGGVIPSLTQAARFFHSTDGVTLKQTDLTPESLGIQQEERAAPLPDSLSQEGVRSVKAPGNPFAITLAEHAASCGLKALEGEPGYARDALIYGGSIILYSQGKTKSLQDAAKLVAAVLDNGYAQERLVFT